MVSFQMSYSFYIALFMFFYFLDMIYILMQLKLVVIY